jgi:proteasome maturation protein
MPAMPQSNIHLDILEGRDEILDATDFFRMSSTYFSLPVAHLPLNCLFSDVPTDPPMDIHADMERKLRM